MGAGWGATRLQHPGSRGQHTAVRAKVPLRRRDARQPVLGMTLAGQGHDCPVPHREGSSRQPDAIQLEKPPRHCSAPCRSHTTAPWVASCRASQRTREPRGSPLSTENSLSPPKRQSEEPRQMARQSKVLGTTMEVTPMRKSWWGGPHRSFGGQRPWKPPVWTVEGAGETRSQPPLPSPEDQPLGACNTCHGLTQPRGRALPSAACFCHSGVPPLCAAAQVHCPHSQPTTCL